ncbi:hypothetical protein PHYBLDRAFT_152097 [Phycomyces blakesleeanus NRRL 1555(-)]|uniref:Uncharacterized protein n=1 Tax=Phycomyces blakesleeanus (strain ATCC 8743b / DSM 1359 / FGSC 10004 / NBRC 33097 / NRRL 1555) TaxID=763407 RepID=A0A167JWS8_PHYB8|nr:hypothetical protein PHYBLDRAFT_152097 [Phycomyces blakesleeanus NRRL 1555(-)]OAD66828.1 hypothetical protein PHYBLDRAFT_152097 [Phycomyces blakesleeanus NRRL 1555(-)]|eukprot:XP_018284868.1 hypothetical protein PHYBLDRAFT_152097 [Phycomyces blakesleeanus NRRL 1555(-)]
MVDDGDLRVAAPIYANNMKLYQQQEQLKYTEEERPKPAKQEAKRCGAYAPELGLL